MDGNDPSGNDDGADVVLVRGSAHVAHVRLYAECEDIVRLRRTGLCSPSSQPWWVQRSDEARMDRRAAAVCR